MQTDLTNDLLECSTPGILPLQALQSLVNLGVIHSDKTLETCQFQPNSLDLRLGNEVTRLGCSFLPGAVGVAQRIKQFGYYTTTFSEEGILLEKGQIYLFKLAERLSLPRQIMGFANPKSTTGRLDVFARLIIANGLSYDKVPAGYSGDLYLEVVPRSFPIILREGDRLAQLRLFIGNPYVSDDDTAKLLNESGLLCNDQGKPLRADDVSRDDGLLLSPRLQGPNNQPIGYHAKRNAPPIDYRKKYSIKDYWDVLPSCPDGLFVLEPDQFYIFASQERIALPSEYCAEMVPFDATAGEVRTHYAGFFDSGFGSGTATRDGRKITGAAAVLEVRSRDVFFALAQGQPLFRLKLLKNLARTCQSYGEVSGASYQHQDLRLAKQFI